LFFEVLIYVQRIEVETKTLLVLTLAQAFGGMIGATLANKAKQTDMAKILGFSLVIIAIFLVLKQYGFLTFLSSHNNAIGLSGIKLIIATIVLIIVGIFAAFGVGQYAPTIVTLYILGLSPLTAFPIMTVSSGIACLVISIKSIKHKTCSFVACATSAIPSVIGVFIGSTLLLYINPIILIYITCPIIAYTGISFLIDGFKRK
jgi:uncharacterized membrane protein YfcA